METKDTALNKRALKSGLFFVISQIFISGITFLATPIYTRLMSTEQYGRIRVYESWLQIAVPVMSLCLWKSVERAKYDMRNRFDSYTSALQTLSYASIAVMSGLCLIFKDKVEAFCNMDGMMLYVGIGYVFAYTSVLYMNRREKQSMRYKFATVMSIGMMVPAAVISIAWLYWGNVTGHQESLVHYRILGFYLPQIIGGLLIAAVMTVQGKTLVSKEFWKYGLIYSLPLIPEVLSIQIMNQADKIMIQNMIGEHEAGIFALATTISFIIWILEDSVWNAYLPWLYEKISRGQAKDAEKPWGAVMHMFGLMSWLLVLFAPEIILVLGGKKYGDAVWLVAPMVLGTLFRFYSYSYTAVQNYHKKTAYVAVGTIAAMLVNVVLNYVCILHFGYQAAAYTTAVSYMFLLVLQGWLEQKITGQRIIPMRRTLMTSFLYLTLNLLSMTAFALPAGVRYIVILAVLCAGGKMVWPQFLAVIKEVKKK